MSKLIGGWGCESFVRRPPNREIDFDCACVACVRACVRAKLRERDVSPVARVGQADLWGSPSALPWWGACKNSEFQSQPFELQIGLLDFKKMGKRLLTSHRLAGMRGILCFSEDLGFAPLVRFVTLVPRSRWSRWFLRDLVGPCET